jgi:hypothetical protein
LVVRASPRSYSEEGNRVRLVVAFSVCRERDDADDVRSGCLRSQPHRGLEARADDTLVVEEVGDILTSLAVVGGEVVIVEGDVDAPRRR